MEDTETLVRSLRQCVANSEGDDNYYPYPRWHLAESADVIDALAARVKELEEAVEQVLDIAPDLADMAQEWCGTDLFVCWPERFPSRELAVKQAGSDSCISEARARFESARNVLTKEQSGEGL